MDEPDRAEDRPKEFNKIDLSPLEDFHFGTQWTDAGAPSTGSGAPRRRREAEDGDFRRSRPEGRRDRRPSRPAGGPQREAQSEAGRPERPSRERFSRPVDQRPYVSPTLDFAIYPEDQGFAALVKAMRTSCRTYELFEIAQLILAKAERFVMVVRRKPEADGKIPPISVSVPDGLPFETEEAAIQHVWDKHLSEFFEVTETEGEPPKGNFQFVSRCGMTGELLGPPNYHRYSQILNQHHADRLERVPFERFRERIETVRDPEVIAAWMEKMKRVTRFTSKLEPEAVFDSRDEARQQLLSKAKDRVVRPMESARFHARLIEQLPAGEIRRGVEGHLERQRRFPLDTANALRGRLRREGFTIFKKGAKGVSYVCSVKRKFRQPEQTFSESISALISFIEANPMVHVRELPERVLRIVHSGPAPDSSAAGHAEQPVHADVSPEDAERIRRLWMDLRWLVVEGYVTEFSDGKLFAPPPALEPKHRDADEHEGDEQSDSEDSGAEAQSASPADSGEAAESQPAEPELEPPAPAATTGADESAENETLQAPAPEKEA